MVDVMGLLSSLECNCGMWVWGSPLGLGNLPVLLCCMLTAAVASPLEDGNSRCYCPTILFLFRVVGFLGKITIFHSSSIFGWSECCCLEVADMLVEVVGVLKVFV